MADTSIEWADKVWNPVTGCSKVSQGCKNCYAEVIANRFWGERKFTDVQCHPERLEQPPHWRKPARIFVNSMSDLFHQDVPLEFVLQVWMMMAEAKQHTFIILTKRPWRMKLFVNDWLPGAWGLATMSMRLLTEPIPNIWLGVSVENQQAASERIPYLLQTPAAVRFVSCEPMLERLDLSRIDVGNGDLGDCLNHKIDRIWDEPPGVKPWGKVDWVIAGGESGAKARPHPPLVDVRYLKDQCVEAGVPFFLKQMWGEKMPELDGTVWNQFPEE